MHRGHVLTTLPLIYIISVLIALYDLPDSIHHKLLVRSSEKQYSDQTFRYICISYYTVTSVEVWVIYLLFAKISRIDKEMTICKETVIHRPDLDVLSFRKWNDTSQWIWRHLGALSWFCRIYLSASVMKKGIGCNRIGTSFPWLARVFDEGLNWGKYVIRRLCAWPMFNKLLHVRGWLLRHGLVFCFYFLYALMKWGDYANILGSKHKEVRRWLRVSTCRWQWSHCCFFSLLCFYAPWPYWTRVLIPWCSSVWQRRSSHKINLRKAISWCKLPVSVWLADIHSDCHLPWYYLYHTNYSPCHQT